MDSFEINKIIAAVLVTVLVIFGITSVSDIIFAVKKPDIVGYKVEIDESSSSTTEVSSSNQVDISALLDLVDIYHVANVFKKCSS